MKKENIFIFRVISIILLILLSNVFLIAREKTYSPEEGLPNIKKYPKEIQQLDSIKTDYYKQKKQYMEKNESFEISEKYLKEYAKIYFKYFMKYSNIHNKGPRNDYMNESHPVGMRIIREMKKLDYPWNLMYLKKGLILGEIVDDDILPKRETELRKYLGEGPNIYVLTVNVIEDVFDSCDEDTILVRHCKSIYDDYSEYKDMKALLTVRPGATIQRADSVQYIYLLGGPEDIMFVDEKGVIYDPNKILNKDSVMYKELKSDVLNILK